MYNKSVGDNKLYQISTKHGAQIVHFSDYWELVCFYSEIKWYFPKERKQNKKLGYVSLFVCK